MNIIAIDPADRTQADAFLRLPFRLYQQTPQWAPPFAGDARRMLDRQRHPFYQHSQAAFFLALGVGGRPVGRIAVLDHRRYNDHNHERTAFFYLFECENDPEPAQSLFEAAFAWARGRGLDRMIGPRGFTALDGLGLLVRGFEHRPALGIPYNPAYYQALVEAAGFTTQEDIVSGHLDVAMQFPARIHELAERVRQRRGLRILSFQRRRDLRAIVPSLRQLYNAALGETTGNYPLTDDEVKTIADQMLRFADPRLIKIVAKGDEPVGFLFAYPDPSAALQRTGGRLFPFGWAQILLEMRRTRWININGAGIRTEYRGLGGTAILFSELYKTLAAGNRFTDADLVQIGVENANMQRELRDLGVDFYKMHRMYERGL